MATALAVVGAVGPPAPWIGPGAILSTRSSAPAAMTELHALMAGEAALAAGRAAYFRPVIADGKAFPVARSNFVSLLEFPDNWHAPRLRLVGGRWKLIGIHEGIDIMAERGTPVLAMQPGVVENVGWTFYSGTRVGIRGTDGRYYLYAHLSSVESGVVAGRSVPAGAVLGRVGNTGYGPPGHRDEFPPHLHFGIEVGGEWVDPYPTLVQLYDATVRTTTKAQRQLDRLALAGGGTAWTELAAATYLAVTPGT